MLTLMLLRHAKAVHSSQYDDIDRPLALRGQEDAALIGAYVAAHRYKPDIALVSTACRTRETWEIVKAHTGPTELSLEEALYHASAQQMLKRLHQVKGKAETVLMVGHNPSIAYLANLLAGEGEAVRRKELHSKFPTCALAILTFNKTAWRDVAAGGGVLEHFLYPKLLGGPE